MKLIISTCILIFCMIQKISCVDPIVEVEQGPVRGELLQTITGEPYYSFKGIPYAKPPVGQLRFKAPIKPEPWDGVHNATAHGAVCPQVNFLTNQYIPGSENCLFLNVYTSNLTVTNLIPVMVFIHGGSYKFGSGNDDMYGPDFLVQNDIVLVTINYRLDLLGFLNLGTAEVPGNAGLKDQVLALKWVKTNIQKFGGNPNSVTIYGESAGAASVGYHLVSKMSAGLFNKAILSSGTPCADFSTSYRSEARGFKFGRQLGFETKNASALLAYLQSLPYNKLVNTTCAVLAAEEITTIIFKRFSFGPVIEKDCGQERFLTEDPLKSLVNGNVNNADVMFGYNSQESLLLIPFYVDWRLIVRYNMYPELFVPSKILTLSSPDVVLNLAGKIIHYYFGNKTVDVNNISEFISYSSMASIIYDIHRFFRKWPQVGNRYFYKFSGYSSRNYYGRQGASYGIEGASHLDELCYVFDPKSLGLSLEKDSKEYEIMELITTVFTNFAKYGNPTPANSSLGVTWPQYNNKCKAYVDIAEELTVGYAPDESEIKFWKTILETAGIKF